MFVHESQDIKIQGLTPDPELAIGLVTAAAAAAAAGGTSWLA